MSAKDGRTCGLCSRLETFEPRSDEPSNMGCRAPGWEGYVTDTNDPPCGGIALLPSLPPRVCSPECAGEDHDAIKAGTP